MRWFWIFLTAFALLVLEASVVPVLREAGGGPDLLLLLVMFVALYGSADDAPIVGWIVGAARDWLSTGPFGLYAVSFLVAGFVLSRIRSDIFLEGNKAHAANAGLGTLVFYLGTCGWRWSQGADFAAIAPTAIGVAVWNACLAPFVFGIFFTYARHMGASRRAEDV